MNIFITGATSGFGKAIAEKFAKDNHHNIWISGRRGDRLLALKNKLETSTGTQIWISEMDVRNKEEVDNVAREVRENWPNLDLLVNNAGLALGLGSIEDGDVEDWNCMIDTNIKGLLYVTKSMLPLLSKKRGNNIINIGSTAGKIVYQGGNVYCATKFAVDALTQSLRIELLEKGIKVTAINPGMAETEFSLVRFKANQQQAKSAYQGFIPLTAEDIADAVYYCANLPENVCINDLTITCLQQANSIYKHSN